MNVWGGGIHVRHVYLIVCIWVCEGVYELAGTHVVYTQVQ